MQLLLKPNEATPAVPELTWRAAMGYVKQGIVKRLAKFAHYRGAFPTATTGIAARTGMNANSSLASIQRAALMWNADDVAKNCALAGAYYKIRTNYCDPLSYVPNTGDDTLNAELRDYLNQTWKTGGINCSFFEAFSRLANIELPVRGDSLGIYFRDETQLRLMEASADQIGRPYHYTAPASQNGVTYYAGIYASQRNGERIAFEVFERVNEWYGARRIYPASDCLYFQDNIFRGWRGITAFANALQHMDKGEHLFQIGMDAAMRQSKDAFAVFNQSGAPDEVTYETVNPDGSVSVQQYTEGGPSIQYRYTGDSISPVPRDSPGEELIQGVEKSDERVALALGLTYAFMVSGEKVGGAPSRFDCARAGREIERVRDRVLRARLDQHAYICIMDAVDRGIFPASENIARGDWHFSNLPSADAYKDSMDDIKSVRAGQESDTRVLSRYGTTPQEIARDKENETVLAYLTLARTQKRLKDMLRKEGLELKDVPSIADIRQVSDNPAQAAQPDAPDKSLVAPNAAADSTKLNAPAQMAAYMGDVSVADLPDETRAEIARILGTNGDTDSLRVIKYGMVAPELERMADPHNLESARRNIRYCTNGSCADEVHANGEKYILLNNGRIVDGHHFLARALKGRVTKSLPVIDLTPARFQTAQMARAVLRKSPKKRTKKGAEG